ncbi:hypothetical protein [Streptomyces sp. DHE17-7]|uniref:hypothetical protein n=1 Tax=Streptomyces sp. DHE17-7 TaxID=2759949 RepID=UPI0022EA82FF|nr:hypothetical protein [Streptomyces sp. DHE17-7]MBJ6623428.1 hypothetical protein [Streptomyces sp. DHE17-7]
MGAQPLQYGQSARSGADDTQVDVPAVCGEPVLGNRLPPSGRVGVPDRESGEPVRAIVR